MSRRKTYRGMARDLWPGAEWIVGEEPWAVVGSCGYGTTVTLWDDLHKAEEAIQDINHIGCNGFPRGQMKWLRQQGTRCRDGPLKIQQ